MKTRFWAMLAILALVVLTTAARAQRTYNTTPIVAVPGGTTSFQGIAVNRNPGSRYNGYVYACNTSKTSPATPEVVIYKPSGSPQGSTYTYTSAVVPSNGTSGSPFAVAIGTDDSVWLVNTSTTPYQIESAVHPDDGASVTAIERVAMAPGTFTAPRGFAISGNNDTARLYVGLVTGGYEVQAYDVSGSTVTTTATWSLNSSGTTPLIGYAPYGITIGPDGSVYLPRSPTSVAALIQKVNSNGTTGSPSTLAMRQSWMANPTLCSLQFVSDASYAGGGYFLYGTRFGTSPYNMVTYRYDASGNYLDGVGIAQVGSVNYTTLAAPFYGLWALVDGDGLGRPYVRFLTAGNGAVERIDYANLKPVVNTVSISPQSVSAGGSITVSAGVTQAANALASVTVDLSALGGSATATLTNTTPLGNGSFVYSGTFAVSSATGGTKTLTVTAIDSASVTNTGTGTFSLIIPPSIGTVSVTPASILRSSTTSITISVPVSAGTNAVSSVSADLSPLGGSSTQALTNSAGTWSATVSVTPSSAGSRTINVTATDAGGFTSTGSGSVSVVTPPTVGTVSITPSSVAADRATSVTISVPVTAGTNAVSSVSADLSPLGGSSTQALSNSAGTWSATVSVSPSSTGSKTINVTATDADGFTSSGSGGVSVVTPPSVGTVSIAPSSVPANWATPITVSVPVTAGTNAVSAVSADLSPLGGSSTQALANIAGTWCATVSVTPPSTGSKTINVTATDTGGITSTGSGVVPVTLTTGSSIPARFGKGALLATQTRPTNVGDNLSELDQLFGTSDGGNLRLGITGNIENSSGRGIIILLDTKPGGNNPFNYSSGGADQASDRIYGLNSNTFDPGFNPDYAIDTNLYAGTLYADLYDLQANSNSGSKTYLGGVSAPGTTGFGGGGEMSFDNFNTAGVTGADATNAATATTGLEISLPLSRIGNPSGPVKIMVVIGANNSSGELSNQFLPGLPDTYGGFSHVNLVSVPGRQYVTMTPGWTASDLPLTQMPWTFEDRVFTGDSSLDNHPPVVNPPTIYNGRAYVVEDVAHYGGSHSGNLIAIKTTDGTLDTSFGTNGRVALSGPATGRVAVRSVGGVVRLFVAATDGTLYSMDASNGGNVHSLALGGTTASTPAVTSAGPTATAYVPVNAAGSWQLKQVADTTSMSQSGSLTLIGVTDITSSPSVIADGTRIQIAGTTATGGVVYTVSSDLNTVFTTATTGNPVKAPPTLSSDSTRFYVGDAPASGNGSFYCFNASTGAQINSVAISGGLEYAAFGDYSVGNVTNALYFATDTGQLNALNPSTLSQLPGYPATPLGLEPATGAVALLNGQIYIPTTKGMFVVPSSAPTSFLRFATEAQASTPSAAGRVTGSVMATTSSSGLVNGISAQ